MYINYYALWLTSTRWSHGYKSFSSLVAHVNYCHPNVWKAWHQGRRHKQQSHLCSTRGGGDLDVFFLKKKRPTMHDIQKKERHEWDCLVIILSALACIHHNLMHSVLNIWCDILILLLPDIWSSGFQPPQSQCDSLFKLFVEKDFATWVNKKKKKKLDTHQMLLHTTFPWIRAVTWQPCCLSIVVCFSSWEKN